MAYKIVYSELAIETLGSNIEYLINNWSTKVSVKFLDKVDKTILLIKDNPEFFPFLEESNNRRKTIIVLQITMFYEVEKDIIKILLFWNNYQNPEKLKELLK